MDPKVIRQIRECDKEYGHVHRGTPKDPGCNICKRLMIMGYELNDLNLPIICINYCHRWSLG